MSLSNLLLNWWYGLGGKFPPTIRWDPVSGQGSQGQTVKMWQTVIDAPIVDGSFGPMTDTMTKGWQGLHGIDPDGVVGPLTWTAAMKGVGNASSPRVASGAPSGTRPLPQKTANQPAITAFAVETLNDRGIGFGQTSQRFINGVNVLARIEPHTWTHRAGKLVTGLNPPIRGVTLYEVVGDAQVGLDGTEAFYRVSDHGWDVGGEGSTGATDQGGHMAEMGYEVGSQGEHGCPSDIRGNPDKYKLKI